MGVVKLGWVLGRRVMNWVWGKVEGVGVRQRVWRRLGVVVVRWIGW